MKIKLYDVQYDNVIKSFYLTVGIDYEYALKNLVPLINKLDFQRNTLRASFYQRLERDIEAGCIMPNITVAIKLDDSYIEKLDITEQFINEHIGSAFVLDGIQRLNTLSRISDKVDINRTLYCNILLSSSMDRLLYRMVTLNNGQKPMSARHQIEILANNIFEFDKLAILGVTEKDKKQAKNSKKDSMNKDDLIKGYLSYISNSVNIDNQKIIEEKMNELIGDKIMDSNITEKSEEFEDVIEYISLMIEDEFLNKWFKVANNFIGFSAAMNVSFKEIRLIEKNELSRCINSFEEAFSAIDVSKIKLGTARRKMVKYYFENFSKLSSCGYSDLLDVISQEL